MGNDRISLYPRDCNAYNRYYWPGCYLFGAGGFICYWRFREASPLIVELANITRADSDFVPDDLDAGGFKRNVTPSEQIRLWDLQRNESGAEKARAEFVRQQKKRSSMTQAFKKTVEMTGYSERPWTMTEDLRARRSILRRWRAKRSFVQIRQHEPEDKPVQSSVAGADSRGRQAVP